MRHIASEDEKGKAHFLVITRRIAAGEEAEYLLQGEHEVIESNLIRLGRLDILTNRELEVLTLVGQGMSTKEIAKVLFRSVKTIENHRDSLAKKLGRVKGVELARIAREAGLMPSDEDRERV
ncbi:MAG: response regulator transcription factor [Phycisphaerales bacterium]|nr:response regulator transcription factor [Phycisphaerales bacterium]